MNNFVVEDVGVKGVIRFFKLKIDGVCAFDMFIEEVLRQGNLQKQLIGIFSIMDQVADLKLLPKEKFRDITPAKEAIKEFEIKKGDLRLYLIKEHGHIIILGGKKNSQQDDIRQFRSIKKRYLETKRSGYDYAQRIIKLS